MDQKSLRSLPKGWTETTLDEVALWGSGGTPSRKNPKFYEGSIPWVKTGELGPKYLWSAEEHITKDAIEESSARVFPQGSVGIAMYGATIGKLSIWAADLSVNQACAVAQPLKEIIVSEFLYYFLLSQGHAFIERGKGGAQPNISQSILKTWPVCLPPTNEQHRIVAKIDELFSELDKGIESLKTARRQLEVYRQAVLKHAFEGKLTAQWREENKDKLETPEQLLARIQKERAALHEWQLQEWKANANKGKGTTRRSLASRPAKLKDVAQLLPEETDGLPALPDGWSYVRVGLLIDEPKYGTSKKCDYNFEGTGVLRIPNVVRGLIDDADLKGACFEDDEKWAYSLRSGDILMIRSNGSISIVGKSALVSSAEQRYLYAGYLIRIRANSAVVLPEYLALLISSHLLRVQIEGFAKSTSGVNNINSGEIQSLIVPLCSVQEQQDVVAQLSATISEMDATATEVDGQLRATDTLHQAILKKAFAGQLVAQDPSDEPASLLLEKIRTERVKAGKSGPTAKRSRKATAA